MEKIVKLSKSCMFIANVDEKYLPFGAFVDWERFFYNVRSRQSQEQHRAKAHSRQAKANRTTPTSRIPPLRGVRGCSYEAETRTPP